MFTVVVALVDVALMVGAVLLGYALLTVIWPLLPADWQDPSGYLHGSLHVWYKTALVAFSIVAIYTFAVHGLYRPPTLRQRGAQAALALRAVSVLSAFFYFAVWMDRTNYCIERQIVILSAWLIACALLLTWRGVVVPRWMSVGLWRRNTVILGAGESGQFVAGQQRRFDRAGFELIGFLDDKARPGLWHRGRRAAGARRDQRRIAGEADRRTPGARSGARDQQPDARTHPRDRHALQAPRARHPHAVRPLGHPGREGKRRGLSPAWP